MKEVDLIVIGAGPAGVAAAGSVARRGGSVLMVDENLRPGGKVLSHEPADQAQALGKDRLKRALDPAGGGLEIRLGTLAWSVEPDLTVALGPASKDPDHPGDFVRGRSLLLAGGARERIWPFEGWTLPGVFTLGGLSSLVRRGVRPGRRFLIAGAGPLLAASLLELTRAGLDIRALVQAPGLTDYIRRLQTLALGAGWSNIRGLAGCLPPRFPLSSRRVLFRVEGQGRVERAITIKVDHQWRPVPGTERTHQVDAVAVGYGLAPNLEMARALNLDLVRHSISGGEAIRQDPWRRTSRPGVFTAGDSASIKGWEAAWQEGELAAVGISAYLGRLSPEEAGRLAGPLRSGLRRFEAYGRDWENLSGFRPGLLDLLDDGIPLCRCEEVTVGRVRAAVRDGARDLNDLKRRTRLGMGPCQGRFCREAASSLMKMLVVQDRDPGGFTPRLPVRPMALGLMAKDPS